MELLKARAKEVHPCERLPKGIRCVHDVGRKYASTGERFLEILTRYAASDPLPQVRFGTDTALHQAILYERIDYVETVLKSPCGMQLLDVGTVDSEMTPIALVVHMCGVTDLGTIHRMQRIAEKLLSYHPDLNKADAHGRTPLHIAARIDNLELCKKFLLLGGAVDLENESAKELDGKPLRLLAKARQELVQELDVEIAQLTFIPTVLRTLMLGYIL